MNFKNWLLSEEIFPNKTATVYHRTDSTDNIQNILSSKFTPGAGGLYGSGLYTTFDLKSQFTDYMSRYGEYILKFKVTNLDKYLILPINVAKYVLGNNYRISDQFKKILPGKAIKYHPIGKRIDINWGIAGNVSDDLNLNFLDELQAKTQYTSEIFKMLYDVNSWMESELFGVLYNGANDGYCLLKYPPIDESITMLSYAKAFYYEFNKMDKLLKNQGWETSTKTMKIKHISKVPQEKRNVKLNLGINKDLMDAVEQESLNTVKSLIKKGAYNFEEALELAAKKGNLPIIKYLSEKGPIEEGSDWKLGKPLLIAAQEGYLEIVKYFVDHLMSTDNKHYNYILIDVAIRASANGHTEIVKYVVESNELSKLQLEDILTYADNLDIIKYLINKGITSPAALTYSLNKAINKGDIESVKYIEEIKMDNGKYPQPRANTLAQAVGSGHSNIVKYFSKKLIKDDEGRKKLDAVLLAAIDYGNLDIVKYLFVIGMKPLTIAPLIHAAIASPLSTSIYENIINYLINMGNYSQEDLKSAVKELKSKGEERAANLLYKNIKLT